MFSYERIDLSCVGLFELEHGEIGAKLLDRGTAEIEWLFHGWNFSVWTKPGFKVEQFFAAAFLAFQGKLFCQNIVYQSDSLPEDMDISL